MKTIIISRVDNIGDVILTLPLAGMIKEHYPGCTVYFLGKSYTEPIIKTSQYVDKFLNWDLIKLLIKQEQVALFKAIHADAIVHIFPNKQIATLAREAGISMRIGTSHRFYHWFNCNKLVHFSRKNSDLHEVILNSILLRPLGIKPLQTSRDAIRYFGLTNLPELNEQQRELLSPNKINIILHPKSKGSAREWGLDNFSELIHLLPADEFSVFITGSKEEGVQIDAFLKKHAGQVTDLTGKFTLTELIAFINHVDAMVAASTGVLHLAAVLGLVAIGLYAPMRPIFPQRWGPVGEKSSFLVLSKNCVQCKKSGDCSCIRSIKPLDVKSKLLEYSYNTTF